MRSGSTSGWVRRGLVVLACVAAVVLTWGLLTWRSHCQESDGPCLGAPLTALTLVIYTALLAGGLLAIAAAGRRLIPERRRGGLPTRNAAAVCAICLGGIGATPVHLGWRDDCSNGHSAWVPLVNVPYVAAAEPRSSVLTYAEISTLIGCS